MPRLKLAGAEMARTVIAARPVIRPDADRSGQPTPAIAFVAQARSGSPSRS